MQVNKIVLTLRFSKELVDGAWKAIEVGAEAVPSADRSWQEQQRELYAELAGQLKTLFANNPSAGSGQRSARPAQTGAPGKGSASNTPTSSRSSFDPEASSGPEGPDPERGEGEGADEVTD